MYEEEPDSASLVHEFISEIRSRQLKVDRFVWTLVAVVAGFVLAAAVSFALGLAKVFVGLSALAPSVNPDLTISARPIPSVYGTAAVVAVLAGLVALGVGLLLGRALAWLWPGVAAATFVGSSAFCVLSMLVASGLRAQAPWTEPYVWGFFPQEAEGVIAIGMVVLVPTVAFMAGLAFRARSAPRGPEESFT